MISFIVLLLSRPYCDIGDHDCMDSSTSRDKSNNNFHSTLKLQEETRNNLSTYCIHADAVALRNVTFFATKNS